ncbi:hypothetical protein Q3G72_024191 [Acer saccharum]|nr:hypothetical protein Q3G72_024191 [Acer saccharum]
MRPVWRLIMKLLDWFSSSSSDILFKTRLQDSKDCYTCSSSHFDMWLAIENGTKGDWMITMPEHLNMEWVENLRHFFFFVLNIIITWKLISNKKQTRIVVEVHGGFRHLSR